MAATNDEGDDLMRDRLGRAFRNRDNAQWAADYFARDTHAAHSDPAERLRHERHVAAVAQLQDDIAADHAAAEYRATLGYRSGASREQIQVEINKAMADEAYGNGSHKNHAQVMDRLSYLYRQLHPSK